MKKDAEKGWSGDGKTAGQSWIQEDTLDPIDGCQVVYRDGNKDERVNITFSLLFRPYLGFHWEPEAFLVITPLKRDFLLINKQTDVLNGRVVNQVKLKFLFHFASSAPSTEKSLAVGLDVVHSADLCVLNLSMFGLSPHCYWNHQTCWPDPAQVIQQVQSEQVFSLKPFYSFRSEAVPGRSPEGNGRLLLAWANNIMRVQRARRPVCVCVCVVVIFFMFFVWNVSVWFVQSEGAWVDVLLPVRIIAHVHWCLGFVWFDGWLLSCSCFWGFGEGWSWKKRPDQQETQLCYGLNKRQEGVLCVCVFSLNKNPPGNLLLPIKKEPKHLSHPTVSLISSSSCLHSSEFS